MNRKKLKRIMRKIDEIGEILALPIALIGGIFIGCILAALIH